MSPGRKIAVVVGTRPEAIKLAPICRALAALAVTDNILVSTGQHSDLLDQTLASLELVPTYSFNVMRPGQDPVRVLTQVAERCTDLFTHLKPESVVVQGDTTTVLATALAAFHLRIPVAHVEAGLRTYDFDHPFPEEANRQLVDRLSTWCFAPTDLASQNLLREGIAPERVIVTGNTAVDCLLWTASRVQEGTWLGEYLLVTLHRRESFGHALREILHGVRDFLESEPRAQVIWPVHPNPHVSSAAAEVFGGNHRVTLRPPLDYSAFVGLLKGSKIVLTDSGGIQEEAPSLGKTVLVAREKTERPEALTGGKNRLVGRDRTRIREELVRAWAEPPYEGVIPAPSPFGDGNAGARIARHLTTALGRA